VVELLGVMACACATGSGVSGPVQNVSLRMTDRATGSDVTPNGFPRVRACPTGILGHHKCDLSCAHIPLVLFTSTDKRYTYAHLCRFDIIGCI
jgi:hypothetical protein